MSDQNFRIIANVGVRLLKIIGSFGENIQTNKTFCSSFVVF
jgi:hypothetical protein